MIARFPCLECGSPHETRSALEDHWRFEGHGPRQVALDAVDRARYSVMGDDAPEPESAYHSLATATVQRRRLRIITGGRLMGRR